MSKVTDISNPCWRKGVKWCVLFQCFRTGIALSPLLSAAAAVGVQQLRGGTHCLQLQWIVQHSSDSATEGPFVPPWTLASYTLLHNEFTVWIVISKRQGNRACAHVSVHVSTPQHYNKCEEAQEEADHSVSCFTQDDDCLVSTLSAVRRIVRSFWL